MQERLLRLEGVLTMWECRNDWWVPGKIVEAREQLAGYGKVRAAKFAC